MGQKFKKQISGKIYQGGEGAEVQGPAGGRLDRSSGLHLCGFASSAHERQVNPEETGSWWLHANHMQMSRSGRMPLPSGKDVEWGVFTVYV